MRLISSVTLAVAGCVLAPFAAGATTVPDDVAPTTATVAATSTTTAPAGGLDGARARAGFANFAADHPGTGAVTGPCPLVDGRELSDALGVAGVDVTLGTLEATVATTGSSVAIGCRGQARTDVGVTEVWISAVDPAVGSAEPGDTATNARQALGEGEQPISTPTIGGETYGSCDDAGAGTTICVEAWGGDLAVSLTISDDVYVDRPTTSQALVEIIPDVYDNLGSLAGEDANELPELTAEQLATVSATLAQLAAQPGADATCPLLGPAALVDAAAAVGVTTELGDFGWDVVDVGRDAPAMLIRCGGDDDGDRDTGQFGAGASVGVADLGTPAAALEFVASFTEFGSVPDLGADTTTSYCFAGDDGAKFCYGFAAVGSLVVAVSLFSTSDRFADDDVMALLADVTPDLLTTLAGP